jgi:hypothetical protein
MIFHWRVWLPDGKGWHHQCHWKMADLKAPPAIFGHCWHGWGPNWLVVDLPLWKMMEWKSLGMMTFPIWWENNQNVPNHQPAKVEFEFYLWVCWSCRHFSDRHIITVAKRYLEYVPKLKTSYLEPSGNFEKSIYLREKYENAYLEQDNALRTKHMHI